MNKTLKHGLSLITEDHGQVLEFGVYKGNTIKQIRDYLPHPNFLIYGFDSFVGLPEDWKGTTHKAGDLSAGGTIPKIENVKFYKGWFDETLPEYIPICKDIRLIHMDCDLYSSTKTVLTLLTEHIKCGCIIVFDEWEFNHAEKRNDGEMKAFYEWTNENKIEFEVLPSLEEERRIVIIK